LPQKNKPSEFLSLDVLAIEKHNVIFGQTLFADYQIQLLQTA
jgi:hypothetical protein